MCERRVLRGELRYGIPRSATLTNSLSPSFMPRKLLGAEIIPASTNPLLTETSSSGMPPRIPSTATSLLRCKPHFSRSRLKTRSGESPRLVTPIFLPLRSSGPFQVRFRHQGENCDVDGIRNDGEIGAAER